MCLCGNCYCRTCLDLLRRCLDDPASPLLCHVCPTQYPARRTLDDLAVLCITAGVATVVALRSLGLAVGDTLTNNVRIEIKGDLLIRNDSIFGGFGSNDPNAFSPAELDTLLTWAEDNGAQVTAYMSGRNMQLTPLDANQFGRPSFIGSNFVDRRPTRPRIPSAR